MKWIAPLALGLALAANAAAVTLTDAKTPGDIRLTPRSGRLLVVNVWATWCVPCVHEIADLKAIHDAYRRRGVEMLGVSLDDVLPGGREKIRARVERFLTQKKVPYANIYYLGKHDALADALRFEGEIPVTFVFDSRGREVFRIQGVVERGEFSKRLDKLLD